MNIKFSRTEFIHILLAIIGIVVFVWFYNRILPSGNITLYQSQQKIEQISFQTVSRLGYDVSDYKKNVNFRRDRKQFKYLGKTFETAETIDAMRDSLPVYYWEIRWHKSEELLDKLKNSDENENVTVTIGDDSFLEALSEFHVTLNTRGEILKVRINYDEKAHLDSLADDAVMQRAEDYFKLIDGDHFDEYTFFRHLGDSVHTLTWKRNQPIVGENVDVKIELAGNRLVRFEKNYNLPAGYVADSDKSNFVEIPGVLVFLVYFVVMIVLLVQRLRRDEISMKSGIVLSILVAVSTAYSIIISTSHEGVIEVLIPMLIGPVFIAFFMMAIFSISESVARDQWPEKLLSFDALNRLNIRSSLFSRAVIRGLTLAFLSLGLVTLVGMFAAQVTNFYLVPKDRTLTHFVTAVPVLYILFSSLTSTAFGESIFRLFTISYLKSKITRNSIILIASGILWTFSFVSEHEYFWQPIYFHIIKNFLIGLLFGYFFIRYDFLTVFLGSIMMKMVEQCYPMLFWGQPFMLWNGVLFLALIGVLIIIAIAGYRREIDQNQLNQYTPPYIHRMKERERLKRELEIARKVQLSFLPSTVPNYPGLDVATVCIPANEVGGDYYDFLDLGEQRFGVVIGDVSGKGIPAAFHMTLTKGFLKSQVRESFSPQEVLSRLNELFYENVSRGNFISMIYGIFDLNKRTLTISRAGHNPIIIRSGDKKQIDFLCPKGIALGLEKGKLFRSFIEEQNVKIRKSDLFVFYTDGVSEAMNNDKDEFGEERLEQIIRANSHVTAKELIDIIQNKINVFVGDMSQHDDMTMIIVKIG